jgi:2,4-dichlorophenol 6-monooxygenase
VDTMTLPPPAFSPFTSVDGIDTDVVVVGLGPAGATAALALATYGVRVHAVTMFPWVANSPRAHITNQRAVEVLRDLELEDEARKYATPWDQMGDTLFTTSLGARRSSACRPGALATGAQVTTCRAARARCWTSRSR